MLLSVSAVVRIYFTELASFFQYLSPKGQTRDQTLFLRDCACPSWHMQLPCRVTSHRLDHTFLRYNLLPAMKQAAELVIIEGRAQFKGKSWGSRAHPLSAKLRTSKISESRVNQ